MKGKTVLITGATSGWDSPAVTDTLILRDAGFSDSIFFEV
jgi:NADP-dependent 3-hydroxy acid dehydrogenase YdfG